MRSRVIILSAILFVLLLSSCGLTATPIENPQIDKFEEYYVDDNYTVLIRSEIDPEMLYHMIAYGFGTSNDQCSVGAYEEENCMVYYKEKYYDIVEFNKFYIIS